MEILAVIVVVYLASVAWSLLKRKGRKLPPGPYPLPIIGNMFQVNPNNIHQSYADLSRKYGPLVSIRIGSVLTVVISSPEMAKEALTRPASTDRPILEAVHSHNHVKLSVGFLPVADQKWKDMRRICKEQMFANHNLESSQWLRHKKLLQLVDYLQVCCDAGRVVNIREAAFTTTLNLTSAMLFSADATEFDSSTTTQLKDLTMKIANAFGSTNFADYFPILKSFDLQGVRREADIHFGTFLRLIKTRIDERVESRRANQSPPPKPHDFLDTLVDSVSPASGYNLTIDDIKHLLFDLYTAGGETTMITIEWAMTELLAHPVALSKAKDELRNVTGDKKLIQEADISKLPYLQAVIKEVFRLHPPAPLLSPRKAIHDMEIKGYFIPKGTQLYVNAWAIGRDSNLWPNPNSFEPERFLNKNIDFKGQNFQLIPFGSGARICPGLPLANRTVHAAVAAFIHNFDWMYAQGESEHNGELLSGPALRREAPLMAIPLNKAC